MSARRRLLLALALLAGGAWLGRPAGSATSAPGEGRAAARATAHERLLVPLPASTRALLAVVLWTRGEWGDPANPPHPREELARALLSVAPDLDGVRVATAEWLVTRRAPLEVDAERHRARLAAGLRLLDERLAVAPRPALHAALGALLARADEPRGRRVVEQLFGESGAEVAIHELRRAGARPRARRLLAELLVERGIAALERHADADAAVRDLEEAASLLRALGDARAAELARQVERLRAAPGDGRESTRS